MSEQTEASQSKSSAFYIAKASISNALKLNLVRAPVASTAYASNQQPDKIHDGLYLSSWHMEQQADLKSLGITHVLQVGSELRPSHPTAHTYKRVELEDLEGEDIVAHLAGCIDFIDKGRSAGGVLVHCLAGISRSASVVIAYLMAREGLPLQAAKARVRAARPIINPNQGFTLQLQLWMEAGCSAEGWEPWSLQRFITVREQRGWGAPSLSRGCGSATAAAECGSGSGSVAVGAGAGASGKPLESAFASVSLNGDPDSEGCGGGDVAEAGARPGAGCSAAGAAESGAADLHGAGMRDAARPQAPPLPKLVAATAGAGGKSVAALFDRLAR